MSQIWNLSQTGYEYDLLNLKGPMCKFFKGCTAPLTFNRFKNTDAFCPFYLKPFSPNTDSGWAVTIQLYEIRLFIPITYTFMIFQSCNIFIQV